MLAADGQRKLMATFIEVHAVECIATSAKNLNGTSKAL